MGKSHAKLSGGVRIQIVLQHDKRRNKEFPRIEELDAFSLQFQLSIPLNPRQVAVVRSPFERFRLRLYTTRTSDHARALHSTADYMHVFQPHSLQKESTSSSMHRHLAVVRVVRLWFVFHIILKVDALAVAPQGSIITAVNQTESPSTPLHLILPHRPLNETLIPYHVPNSPVTLTFHGFDRAIPPDELLRTVAFAVGIAYDEVADKGGKAHIAAGLFVYKHKLLNQNEVEITVGDFREIGLPMNYFNLLDTLRGIGEFVLLRERKAYEVQFEVEVNGVGHLGSGHVEYKPAPPSTSAVA